MLINIHAKTKEEIIPFLLQVGFELITDYEPIPTPRYVYKDDEKIIKITFDNIGLGGGTLIDLAIFDKDHKFINMEFNPIKYLNTMFKHKLRKILIDKLLKEE